MKKIRVFVMLAVLAGLAIARPHTLAGQSESGSAAFDKLKSLVGEWEGSMKEGGKELPATTSFRLVSDNSVLMNVLGAGTQYEMVTMIHMDRSDLMATHYCAGHNQPRFRYVSSSDPNVVALEFKDATNLATPTSPHMVGVKFTLLDSSHHIEDWTYLDNGQTSTSRFDFHRKK
jgi:hypothetical protein